MRDTLATKITYNGEPRFLDERTDDEIALLYTFVSSSTGEVCCQDPTNFSSIPLDSNGQIDLARPDATLKFAQHLDAVAESMCVTSQRLERRLGGNDMLVEAGKGFIANSKLDENCAIFTPPAIRAAAVMQALRHMLYSSMDGADGSFDFGVALSNQLEARFKTNTGGFLTQNLLAATRSELSEEQVAALIRKTGVKLEHVHQYDEEFNSKFADFIARASAGELKDIAPPSPDLVFSLSDVLRLHFTYVHPFDKDDDFRSTFHSPNGNTPVTMMRNTDCPVSVYAHPSGRVEAMFSQALHAKEGIAQILYVMPREFSTSKPIMRRVLDDIRDGTLHEYRKKSREADVSYPATKIETKELDMLAASASLAAEAGKFPSPVIDVKVKQLSVLEISHKGVDAVALTSTTVTDGISFNRKERILIDKPYYFAIYVDKTVISVGQVVSPDEEFRPSLVRS
jgi:hypothetical protein